VANCIPLLSTSIDVLHPACSSWGYVSQRETLHALPGGNLRPGGLLQLFLSVPVTGCTRTPVEIKNRPWEHEMNPSLPTHRAHSSNGVPHGPYSSLGTQQDGLHLLQAPPILGPNGDGRDREADGGRAETQRTSQHGRTCSHSSPTATNSQVCPRYDERSLVGPRRSSFLNTIPGANGTSHLV
jgi:hypothetical protein